MSEKAVRNIMNISKKECAEVSVECLKNADELFEDAKLLSTRGSYGRATSLMVLSMEENMKAIVLFLDSQGFQFRHRVKGIDNLFNNHRLRYPLALLLSIMNLFLTDINSFILAGKNNPSNIRKNLKDKTRLKEELVVYLRSKMKQVFYEIKWFSNAHYLRQDGLYVGFNNGIKTPQTIEKDDFIEIEKRVFLLNKSIFYTIDSFLKKDDDLKTEIKYVQKQLISEGGYRQISELIKGINKGKFDPFSVLKNKAASFQELLGEEVSNQKLLD